MKKIIILSLFILPLNIQAKAAREGSVPVDFMICTTLAGEEDNNNEVNCINTTDMNYAKMELRRRGVIKRDMEKRYSKKLYPREYETSFLPQE